MSEIPDDFKFLIEGSYPEDTGRADGECCLNCAFDIKKICIQHGIAIYDESQWCKKYIKSKM